jgi:hypothetical protein
VYLPENGGRVKTERNEALLERIVSGTPWLVEVLAAVRDHGPPGGYVAAGAIRNTVWDFLHDRVSAGPPNDIDVVYFDPSAAPCSAEARLRTRFPRYRWEVTNQALVHHWQSVDAGRAIPAYPSLGAALGSWPETATAVAARLADSGAIEVLAPFGLDDLFALEVCRNPTASNPGAYDARIASKGWAARWPSLRFEP